MTLRFVRSSRIHEGYSTDQLATAYSPLLRNNSQRLAASRRNCSATIHHADATGQPGLAARAGPEYVAAMSKAEILAELLRLKAEGRAQVFERRCELQERDVLEGHGPTLAEKRLLDRALAEFEQDGQCGEPWRDVLRRLQSSRPR